METQKYEDVARPLVLACKSQMPRDVLKAFENMLQGGTDLPWGFWATIYSVTGATPEVLSNNQSPEVLDAAIAAVAALAAAKRGELSVAEDYYEAAKSAAEKLLSMFLKSLRRDR